MPMKVANAKVVFLTSNNMLSMTFVQPTMVCEGEQSTHLETFNILHKKIYKKKLDLDQPLRIVVNSSKMGVLSLDGGEEDDDPPSSWGAKDK